MPKPLASPADPSSHRPLVLTGAPLTLAELEQVARGGRQVELGAKAEALLKSGRAALKSVLSDGEPHYGINTGFGSFSRQRIAPADLADLQRNLIRSHASGVGKPLATDIVRGMMLLLAASLSRGLSGVHVETARRVTDLLNAGITPVVPEVGSVGASGDLAPLAHVALVLIGEGECEHLGKITTASKALARAGLKPVTLDAKEGLALINGTHLMAASGALVLRDFDRLFSAALVASAMSIDACRATDAFLDARVHDARCQPGQMHVAASLRELIDSSQIIPSHTLNDPRVQDPYSLRCVPQVLGAVYDAAAYVRACVERELGAVTDNPLVFRRGKQTDIVSAGNFHGMPLAIPLDALAIALSHLAGIAERRVYHMLSAFDEQTGLPPYLSPKPGLHSGLMIAQYAAAACCNEIIGLATPASVANISTSAGMEDYNSFGPRSAAKARRALELARSVIAIELLCAGEAVEHHRPLKSSPAVERALKIIRKRVPKLKADRPPAPDIAEIEKMIAAGEIA
jgi:histidine ammonia-lyase